MAEMGDSATTDDKSGKDGAKQSPGTNGVLAQGHDFEDEKERTIAKAALSIAELSELPTAIYSQFLLKAVLFPAALLDGPGEQPSNPVEDIRNTDGSDTESMASSEDIGTAGAQIPLRSINAVAAHVPFVEDARAKVTSEMENMVLTGLTTLVCTFLL
jgi:hypothetical protein